MLFTSSNLTREQRRLLRYLEVKRPRDAEDLFYFVRNFLDLRIPRRAMTPGHAAPFEYLVRTFFEGIELESSDEGYADAAGDDAASPPPGSAAAPHGVNPSADLIVWAGRGGGKTMLGAVATLLDMLFKPGVQVCILGGSFDQSHRMYDYLCDLLARPGLHRMLAQEPTRKRIALINGSAAAVLAQSQRSVRGRHVHKLRCDEVDLFERDVWKAAQMVPRTGGCGGRIVRGSVEAISTMHQPFGPMSRLIERAEEGGKAILKWNLFDVIERCPPARPCEGCDLWDDCRGVAKEADGFVAIDDAINQKFRTDDDTWQAELLCRRPRRGLLVYQAFDPTPGGRHVRPVRGVRPGAAQPPADAAVIGGMDFGIIGDHTIVLALARPAPPALLPRGLRADSPEAMLVEVFEEYAAKSQTLEANLSRFESRRWPRPAWCGVDPAGMQRNRQTGEADIEVLRRRGYVVRHRSTRIDDGIKRIRRRLDRGLLTIDPRCTKLIRALGEYHFNPRAAPGTTPVKDGADHLADALRYMIVNLELSGGPVAGIEF